MNKTSLAIILGGGQGARLFPLTESRSKPAVPIAGKYRLVDIPISNCINSDIKRMFVLTQFNSASLNQHIKNTYHFSHFSTAFVDILAAEQTPDNPTWFQGTADAVRQCMQHFMNHDFDYALILSGDQLYQMDFNEIIKAHEKSGAAITIATLPVNAKDAPEFGILKTNSENFITSFIEKPAPDLLPDWTSEVSTEMKNSGKNFNTKPKPKITIAGKIYLEFTYGILNFPLVARSSNSASLCGESIKTPPHTSTKANKVPILVKSKTKFSSVKNIGIPTTKPVTIVAKLGVLYFG